MKEHGTLLRSASLVTGLTLLSRVFGLIRLQRISFLLGAGTTGDAFTIAFTIPNLLRRLVGEGAVSAAFIPLFSGYLTEDESRREAWRFANAILGVLTVLMTGITVLGILLAPLVVRVFDLGAGQEELATATLLTRIMFPYIFFVSLSALGMGILNSLDRFAAPAFAPVMLNLSIIAFSFLTSLFPGPEVALATGVVVGGVCQIAIQLPQLLRLWPIRPRLDLAHRGVRRAGRLLTPMIAAAGIVQINVAVDVMFTSYMQEGATFALNTADRVMELVLGGYAIAIGTVVLPMLSRSVAAGAVETMRSTLNFAYRMILLVTVPAATGLIVLREPIIQVLFEHGEFDTADTLLTAQPLLYFAIGLVAFSVMKVMIPAFYSLQDTKTPVRIAFFAMLLNVLLNFAFFRPLGVGGPALATSLAGVFSAGALTLLFVRRKGGIGLYSILSSVARFAVGSVLLALVAAWMIAIPGFYDGQSLAARIVALGATIAVAGAVYFGAVAALRCPEVTEVRQILRGRGKEEESGP